MENNDLICPICGEPTYIYFGNPRKDRLCKKHGTMEHKGEIEQCEKCSKWKITGKPCKCEATKETKESKTTNNTEELTCIICGENSNGKHFCYSCYKQFANKVLYIQVKKCKEFTKLEAEYESELTCDDGHMVKSPYEKIIDNWLYSEGIKHAYEKKIDIDETHDLTPDFFIPEYKGTKNIYVEFWGYGEENVQYQRRKEYKTKLYPELVKKENIAVVYLNKKEVDTDEYKKKIKYAEQGKIKE
ncbi:MAG: hypothetical protein J6A95_01775 [Clostridia bacterium]|nr:hypothetical protein [Clostridia bacterium]